MKLAQKNGKINDVKESKSAHSKMSNSSNMKRLEKLELTSGTIIIFAARRNGLHINKTV